MTDFLIALIRAQVTAHMTVEQLAWRMGVTPKTIEHWRAGRTLPTPKNYSKLYTSLEGYASEDSLIELDIAYNDAKTDRAVNRKNKKIPTQKTKAPKWDGKTYIF